MRISDWSSDVCSSDLLRTAITADRVALICTSSAPENLDQWLRDPELCDRELSIGLPDNKIRRGLLGALLESVPTRTIDLGAISARTPGFVAADQIGRASGREGVCQYV